jgi:hypothetical protein
MAVGSPTESGLVIPVPSLHRFVAAWRPKVDRLGVGVPANVTLLYPFIPPARIDAEIGDLRDFFANQPRFSYSLTDTGWFGDEVVFIEPLPAIPFASLTEAIHEHWGLPPYGGAIEQPQPHVTIGLDGESALMHQAEEAALRLLPIHEHANEVWLIQRTIDPPEWSTTHRFPLGDRST